MVLCNKQVDVTLVKPRPDVIFVAIGQYFGDLKNYNLRMLE